MLEVERIDEWRGQDVLDRDGDKLGRLDDIYFDAETREPLLACVKTGLFGRRLSIVPLAGATVARGHLTVAHLKDQVKGAPQVEPDGDLTEDDERGLFEHYGLGDREEQERRRRLVRERAEPLPDPVEEVGPARPVESEGDDRLAAIEQRLGALELEVEQLRYEHNRS